MPKTPFTKHNRNSLEEKGPALDPSLKPFNDHLENLSSNNLDATTAGLSSYISNVCSSCKHLRKHDCDGKIPSCQNCLSTHRTCIYQIESDRRRRKYHGDYIFYLEEKTNKLEDFIMKHDPDMMRRLNSDIDALLTDSKINNNPYQNSRTNSCTVSGQADADSFSSLLNNLNRISLENIEEQRDHSRENLSDTKANTPFGAEFAPYIGVNGTHVYYIDHLFKLELLELFKRHSPDVTYIFLKVVDEVVFWDFSTDPTPSHQLLMCAIFGMACIYSKNPLAQQMQQLFMNQAISISINACKSKLDQYLVEGLLLLSCYEMGMGNDSMSYLFISMACALTQHMGYHISYDKNSVAASFAPQTTPYRSALLWSICTQDRIITTTLGVPACIHFKRIISPFYEVSTTMSEPNSNQRFIDNEDSIMEISFSYSTRLWYILDRFTDQICSIQGDLGDTQESNKLLHVAEMTFNSLVVSMPDIFNDPSSQNNIHVINFKLNYHGCAILLERLFIGHSSSSISSSNKCITSAIEISRCVELLLKDDGKRLDFVSYHFGFICYLAAMIHLVLYVENNTAKVKHLGYLDTCLKALKLNAKNWKRAKKSLETLSEFAKQNGVVLSQLHGYEQL